MGLLGKCESILEKDARVSGLSWERRSQLNEFPEFQDLVLSDDFLVEHSFGEPIDIPEVYGDIMPDFKLPSSVEESGLVISDDTLKSERIEFVPKTGFNLPELQDQKADLSGSEAEAIEIKNREYVDRRSGPARSDRRHQGRQVGIANTLTVMDMRKNFGKKEVVRGVGFSMKGGDVAGLLGPNGAGKTTIFYMIVGFYKPTTGDIKLNGVSITHGPMYRRARMGIAYLPQEASIFRKLTVEQNIWAILESRTDINKKQKKEHLEQLIDDFGIHRIRKQFGYTLSGGERRRTEIARALAIEPKFLLLDEPFAGIDPIAVFEIKQIIKHLAEEGIGVLITDHNVRDTLEITTASFIINRGIIVARGDKDNILANQTVRDVYLGSEFKM
jgi:lipopolysaccharide export system ATP-binding protein